MAAIRDQSLNRTITTPQSSWRWWVCGALLLATFLNYMDRQALSETATEMKRSVQPRRRADRLRRTVASATRSRPGRSCSACSPTGSARDALPDRAHRLVARRHRDRVRRSRGRHPLGSRSPGDEPGDGYVPLALGLPHAARAVRGRALAVRAHHRPADPGREGPTASATAFSRAARVPARRSSSRCTCCSSEHFGGGWR